jgi:hypothetical protein
MSIQTETAGRRTYIIGDTYPHREALRAAGAHWDADRRAWWIGSRSTAEALAASLASTSTSASTSNGPGRAGVVAGRARYKGRAYYVAGRRVRGRTPYDDIVEAVTTRDGSRVMLYSRDGSRQFWAPTWQPGHIVRTDAPIPDEIDF